VSDATGLGTITDDDSASIAINDATDAEGDDLFSGGFLDFTVTLTGTVQGGFTVPYHTVNGTALGGSDYFTKSGTLTFAGSSGETKSLTVGVRFDEALEPNETLTVVLDTPSKAGVSSSDASGLGTITNDDSASLQINDVTKSEGDSGTTAFTFDVQLFGNVPAGFTVPYSTTNGTATQPADYASKSDTLTFAGTPGEIQTITVDVAGDTTSESDETFFVNLGTASVPNISAFDAQGQGTLTNDDAAAGDTIYANGFEG
jgi:hypothetical protein